MGGQYQTTHSDLFEQRLNSTVVNGEMIFIKTGGRSSCLTFELNDLSLHGETGSESIYSRHTFNRHCDRICPGFTGIRTGAISLYHNFARTGFAFNLPGEYIGRRVVLAQ